MHSCLTEAIHFGNDVHTSVASLRLLDALRRNRWCLSVGITGGIPRNTHYTYVYSLAIDPATPTTLYAGTSFDDVFKSTDGAANWSAASTGLPPNTPVRALPIGPTTPTILYAGTDGGGVFKSTDGAATWSAAITGLPPNTYVYSL